MNKHLRNECRDDDIMRLKRQKHAAHASNSRLRWKIRQLELTNRLLMAVYVTTERHNHILQMEITKFAKEAQGAAE